MLTTNVCVCVCVHLSGCRKLNITFSKSGSDSSSSRGGGDGSVGQNGSNCGARKPSLKCHSKLHRAIGTVSMFHDD